jgi:histidyl-tRNA synthetase
MSTQNKSFQSPRGTHDILPSQIAEWRFVEEAFREVCARYNYQEIRTPLFETTELFTRATGESSDVMVTKQMYTFTAPDEQSYTLRPEGTASIVRSYLEHHLSQSGPVAKLFYIYPIFRYEAPQAGRYRQHHQCGIEMLGAAGPKPMPPCSPSPATFSKCLASSRSCTSTRWAQKKVEAVTSSNCATIWSHIAPT